METNVSSLLDMANGAIKERLDYEMGRVIQNIGDPNTKAAAKRTITVKIISLSRMKSASTSR